MLHSLVSSFRLLFLLDQHLLKMPAPLSEREISMILSAICFFRSEGERLNDKRFPVNQKVHECLGVPLATVKKYSASLKENKENLTSPTTRKKQCVQRGRPKIAFDDFTLGIIRRSIFDFYMNKMFPTIEALLAKLKESMPDFPDVSKSTLYRRVKNLGFRFKKLNRKPVLMESHVIAASRRTYLENIKNLRSHGYKIFYTDETWCGQNHTLKYGWQENVIDSLNKEYNNFDQYRAHLQEIYGWRGGFKTPSGAGKRIIILHIGSEEGFLQGGELCFIGKKGTNDYHNEMNALHYAEWFKKILSLLPEKSAIVIDQAPYHTKQDPTTMNPNMSWKKNKIIDWIIKKDISLPPGPYNIHRFTKAQLIVYATPYFGTPEKIVDQLIRNHRPDVKLLWLPVAHCELNPIELIWAYVKSKVAKVNLANAAEKGRSLEVMNNLCKEALRSVTPDLWKKCISHTTRIEDDYWEKDGLTEDVHEVQPLIIENPGLSDSSDEDFNFSDDEM